MKISTFTILLSTISLISQAHADDFAALDQALPTEIDAESIAPVFDFDTDGCLPSAGISRDGDKNGGLKPSGSIGGSCRSSNFLETSNTLHRYTCVDQDGSSYCGHLYALYFEKDQIIDGIESGHRHDWEFATIYTTDGIITHGSYSTHGDVVTAEADELPFENGHLQVVYHKDGVSTHVLRFAKTDESAENPYAAFVTPRVSSWFELTGDGIDNATMRGYLNSFDYGSANLPVSDANFLNNLNEGKPSSYPSF